MTDSFFSKIPILGIAAFSGTGKTTLLTQLLPLLCAQGLRIGIIKHTHHGFDMDKPGKDSYRLREAGAAVVTVASAQRWALLQETDGQAEPLLQNVLPHVQLCNVDAILVEGFKHQHFPKLELHRPSLNHSFLYPQDNSVIAIASDEYLDIPLPLLDLNNPVQIADFIINYFKGFQMSSYCDDNDCGVLTVDQALVRLKESVQPIKDIENLPLRSALGRILAETVISKVNVPAHINSAMDGYAIKFNDLDKQPLKVIGTSWAGKPFDFPVKNGECVRIMTGAKVPADTDTVIMQEHVDRDGDLISIKKQYKQGDNVRLAGEDLAIGDEVLVSGKKLNPADIGLLASLGVSEIKVKRKLRVEFFSTGNELKSVGEMLGDGDIYDSNRYTLFAMLAEMGVEMIDLGVIQDDKEKIRQAFQQAANTADAVITTGGVSVGEADFVKDILEQEGKINFWKVAMKPGKPLAFGELKKAKFFGLPGNPVSAMITFQQFVKPTLQKMTGQLEEPVLRFEVIAGSNFKKKAGRMEFQRGILKREDNQWKVYSTGNQSSAVLSSMSKANCLVLLTADSNGVQIGDSVLVELLNF
jgi:molybdopterin molybdotransferase